MQSLIPPFDPYIGDEPYIFVSYAHKNSDLVFKHILRLRDEGFRIWYDEGIDPGTDWSEEIAVALVKAEVFLVFISEPAVASHNVRKEISFAIDQKKYMVCVHIEETELPIGLKMQLGNIQALLETRFHNKEKFYERLFRSLWPEKTGGHKWADNPIKENLGEPKTTVKAGPASKDFKKPLLGLLATALVAAAVWWWGMPLGREPGVEPTLVENNEPALAGNIEPAPAGNNEPELAENENDEPAPAENDEPELAENNLETILRARLNKPQGDLGAKDLASLTGRLDLSGNNITDITLLRHMTGLSMLNLENNNIVDISPLENLQRLMILGLGHNRISDLTPLGGLGKSLAGLSLAGNPVKDLRQLRPLANLEALDLRGVAITDLELGNYLRKLKSVTLTEGGHGLNTEGLLKFVAGLPPNCELKIDAADGKRQ